MQLRCLIRLIRSDHTLGADQEVGQGVGQKETQVDQNGRRFTRGQRTKSGCIVHGSYFGFGKLWLAREPVRNPCKQD